MSLGLKFCLTEWDGKMEIREGEKTMGAGLLLLLVSNYHSHTRSLIHSSLTHYLFVEVVLTFQVKVGAVG
mgnify:CR=1 FL=1